MNETNDHAEGPAHKEIPSLPDIGERMIPSSAYVTTFWEHIYRYRFALSNITEGTILDIACGSGYGSAILASSGRRVVGVDRSTEACAYARDVYGVDARVGDADQIPMPDNSVSCVVSFETIEHITRPDAFLAECARVLSPGGRLIISTPNKDQYLTEPGAEQNPFHCSEMTEVEFVGALQRHFRSVNLYVQLPRGLPWWSRFGLACDHSWLLRRPLMMRMRTLLQRVFCPHLIGPPSQKFRDCPVEAATVSEGRFSTYINQYQVRSGSVTDRRQAVYFVAIADL